MPTHVFIMLCLIIVCCLIALILLRRSSLSLNEKLIGKVIYRANDFVSVVDKNLKLIAFNEAYAEEVKKLFNVTPFVGMDLNVMLDKFPEFKDKILKTYSNKNTTDEIILPLDSVNRTYEVKSSIICDKSANIIAILHVSRDVTQRTQAQRELQFSYERATHDLNDMKERNDKTTLLLEMSDVMLTCSTAKELGAVMATYCARALNFTSGIFYIMPPSKDRLEECSAWGVLATQKFNFTIDQCWALRMGHIHYVDDHHTRLICDHIKTDNVNAVNYVCVPLRAQNDIYGLLYIELVSGSGKKSLSDSERLLVITFAEVAAISLANVRLRENLRIQSMCDPLTGLYNRRYLGEFLLKQIYQSERTKMPIALLMLDLDHFKKINDVYGHDAGDITLKEISQVLRSNIRPGDFAARYGGEEFIIVLYNTNEADAIKRAETIRKALPLLKVRYGGEDIGPLTVSIGIAIYPTSGKNMQDLIDVADKALYQAKETGRNKVVCFSDIKSKLLESSE